MQRQSWTEARVREALSGARDYDEAGARVGATGDAIRRAAVRHGIDASSLLAGPAPVGPVPSREAEIAVHESPAVLPPPPVLATGRDTLTTVLFDAHVPEHDRPGFSAWLRWCRDERPDEIILSELAEWLSCSQHGGGAWGSSWERDKADVRRALVQVRSVNPEARIIWQESNHDTRLTRILEQRLPQFSGSLTIAKELGLKDLGIEWVGERVALRRGATKIIHGHQLETGGRGFLPKYHGARAVLVYGEPGVTVVYGHVHREQVYVEPCEGGMKRAHSIGCMRTLRPAWHRAAEMGHHNQFAAIYVSAGGGTNHYAIDVVGGSFSFGGRRYAA
jgi:hypothetical protein